MALGAATTGDVGGQLDTQHVLDKGVCVGQMALAELWRKTQQVEEGRRPKKHQGPWVPVSAQPHPCCVPPHLFLNLSGPHFPTLPGLLPGLTGESTRRAWRRAWHVLPQGLANFFCRGPESKYFRHCGPDGLCCKDSALTLRLESSRRQRVNVGWPCANKTLFTKRTVGRVRPAGRGLPLTPHQVLSKSQKPESSPRLSRPHTGTPASTPQTQACGQLFPGDQPGGGAILCSPWTPPARPRPCPPRSCGRPDTLRGPRAPGGSHSGLCVPESGAPRPPAGPAQACGPHPGPRPHSLSPAGSARPARPTRLL
ncbi:uncharacterized protein [Equus caballus]|uniref:uncharacterized protein isoform X4 n=1 Tax=Equus caballus TaxID=9796 RepID=UPI0038B3B9C0